ncbi:MAG: hypothetical protein FWD71_02090 [Oscillospiraceae bacterium]|nr:hypothetical protein [Oscillospiraceae bacterium]
MSNYLLPCLSKCGEREEEIKSFENESMHIAINKSRLKVRQYKLDGEGGILGDKHQSCDYLVLRDEGKKRAYFIELKTKWDLNKAINQIDSAINLLKEEDTLKGHAHSLRIIANLSPPAKKPGFIIDWERDHKDAYCAVEGKHQENI